MEIRKDLAAVAIYLERLSLLGDVFSDNNNKNWSHLRNKEDFEKVYRLADDVRIKFEKIYQVGRDLAVHMSCKLKEFNYPEEFPTLTSYLVSFDKGWLTKISYLEELSDQAIQKMQEIPNCPWAVEQMIALFNDQIGLLRHVAATLSILKRSEIYIIENGGDPVAKTTTVYNISNVSGRVNVNSTDNSVNVVNCTVSELFAALNQAIRTSEIEPKDKDALLSSSIELEAAVGSSSFSAKYKDFIQQAANYMAIISPFIPGLTNLIGG